jgi:hypothetical protein
MKTIALLSALLLASCAEYPIAIAVQGDHGVYSYSAKQGIVITYQK